MFLLSPHLFHCSLLLNLVLGGFRVHEAKAAGRLLLLLLGLLTYLGRSLCCGLVQEPDATFLLGRRGFDWRCLRRLVDFGSLLLHWLLLGKRFVLLVLLDLLRHEREAALRFSWLLLRLVQQAIDDLASLRLLVSESALLYDVALGVRLEVIGPSAGIAEVKVLAERLLH